jgi:hypothetical protein
LAPKMVMIHVDLVANFLWLCSTPQSEFRIKSYGCLKLRWSDFSFYFYCLSSLFFYFLSSFFSLSLSHISFYIWKQMKWDWWTMGFLFLNFDFWIVGFGWTNGEMDNLWEQMYLVRWDILDFCVHEPLLTVFCK